MPNGFTARLALTNEDLRAAYVLRDEVFCAEQGYSADRELDALDDTAAHMVLVSDEDQQVLGVVRILAYPLPDEEPESYPPTRKDGDDLPGGGRTEAQVMETFQETQQRLEETPQGFLLSGGKIGRVAVSKALRGKGAGRMLMEAAEAWIIKALASAPYVQSAQNVQAKIQLSAQVIAKRFYDSLGYTSDDVQYLEEGEPHQWYKKVVSVKGI